MRRGTRAASTTGVLLCADAIECAEAERRLADCGLECGEDVVGDGEGPAEDVATWVLRLTTNPGDIRASPAFWCKGRRGDASVRDSRTGSG